MDWEDYNFGGAFRQNLRRRIRQSLATNRLRQTKRSPTLVEQLPSREPPKYNYLYTKENRANALNLVALVSSEITSNQDISILAEIPIENPEFVGRGATTEVLAVDWKAGDDYPTTRVAIKRVSRDYAPARDKNCPLEHDNLYLTQRDAFYAKVEDMMQEIRIMARVRTSRVHRYQ
jgi:hypothetical protein